MTTPDPILLLGQIANGDEEALRTLYVEYHPRLHRYLWGLLDGDGCAVEEALQDTFLAVWRAAGGLPWGGESRHLALPDRAQPCAALTLGRRSAREV